MSLACLDSRESVASRRAIFRTLARASSALRRSDWSAAIRESAKVLETQPTQLGALEISAQAYWQVGDYEAVERTTVALIRLNPFEPGYFGLRGMALRALGQYGEAARCLKRDPNTAAALEDLEAFQATIVRDLLASDPSFAAAYEKSPVAALTERGFHFDREQLANQWVITHKKAAVAYARPS